MESSKRRSTLISLIFMFKLFLYIVLDCDFENSTFCGWENDKTGISKFNWIIWSGITPSRATGPQSDVSGIITGNINVVKSRYSRLKRQNILCRALAVYDSDQDKANLSE